MTATETATLAGGCFWCLEAVFERLIGVSDVTSGYAGGHVENPSYRQVCSGETGHAEVVRVTFEPGTIAYRELLEVFFAFHDPTTLDRQGPDQGPQYRSAIFPHSDEQRLTAEAVIADLTARQVFPAPIVTTIEPLGTYFEAEAPHQDYYRANPEQPYCRAMVAPKIAKLRQHYGSRLREEGAGRV